MSCSSIFRAGAPRGPKARSATKGNNAPLLALRALDAELAAQQGILVFLAGASG